MPFRVCYYHAIWTTKNRQPLITPTIEPSLISAIMRKSSDLQSPIQAIGCVADHVHVAVSISATIPIATWVQQVKGFAAHEVITLFPDLPTPFRWQKGYGILTFGAKSLDFVTAYIANQKDHHRDNTIDQYLERCEE